MARPFRIAYDGAIYHVTIRGNNDEAVFRDDQDYSAYLEQLAGTIGGIAISLLAYGLMTNHIHVVARTPKPNISRAMHWLHGCYAASFNRRQHRRGPLLVGRFHSSVVDITE